MKTVTYVVQNKDNQININNMKKTETKKTKKPAFIVDLTNIESCEDIKFEFIRGKAKSGIKLTEEEINYLVQYGSHLTLSMIDQALEKYCTISKPVIITDKKLVTKISKFVMKEIKLKKPWYKRAFGWVKNPFKKNK